MKTRLELYSEHVSKGTLPCVDAVRSLREAYHQDTAAKHLRAIFTPHEELPLSDVLDHMWKTNTLQAIFPPLAELNVQEVCDSRTYKNIWTHTLRVTERLEEVLDLDHIKPIEAPYLLFLACLLHDIGKPQAKLFRPELSRWTFYNHETIGAKIAEGLLSKLKFEDNEIKEICTIIAQHGQPPRLKTATDRGVKRFLRLVGDLYLKIIFLAKADVTSKDKTKRESASSAMDVLLNRAETLVKEIETENQGMRLSVSNENLRTTISMDAFYSNIKRSIKSLVEAGVIENKPETLLKVAPILSGLVHSVVRRGEKK